MQIENLIAFNLALLVAIVSPEPALLMAIRTTLVEGRAAGVATGIGLATMAAVWTLLALLGLEAVFKLFPWAYAAAKIAGAAYLLYLAWTTWRDSGKPVGEAALPQAGLAFRSGLLVNLANPKSVLFAAAVLVVIFPAGTSTLGKAVITANHFLIEVVCYSALAFAMNTPAVRTRYLKAKTALDRITALVLGGLSVRLLLQRAAD